MSKKIVLFTSLLDKIEELIKRDLEIINEYNYIEELKNFGYKYGQVEIKDSHCEVKKDIKINNKMTGIYIFKEKSCDVINKKNWDSYKINMYPSNVPNWNKNTTSSKIFYVGKSNTMNSRISQHTIGASDNTYALKLQGFIEIHRNLEYVVDVFYLDTSSQNKAVNELVESILHKTLKPKIGTSR